MQQRKRGVSARSVLTNYKQGTESVESVSSVWDLSTEAEEQPLLEAVAKKQLLKIQQAGNGLAFAAVICEVWKSATVL
jgi:hypothetical protein